jgi:phage/conjugal plasmid C-4 type zinc finger TraR family protein
MADKADVADAYIEQSLETALRNQLELNSYISSDPDCEQCGEPISEARREALPGCPTCVECQHLLEAKNRNYR